MLKSLRSWWQYIQKHWIVAIIIALVIAAMVLILTESLLNGTGFNGYYATSTTRTISASSSTISKTETYQPGKTLWDWLQLLGLVAIPVVVGLGAALYSARQAEVSEKENIDNQREAALQGYIDKMSELLRANRLGESAGDEQIRHIARVRTLTVLRRLDAERKGSVLQFLYESRLIDKDKPIVDLQGADLSEANLLNADLDRARLDRARLDRARLDRARLSGAKMYKADLSDTNLRGANLSEAYLRLANLRGANLRGANLSGANLSEANLSRANLSRANLSRANLSFTDLRGANLSEADLSRAELNRADLRGAKLKGAIGITIEELEKKAKSLQDTTKPDGSKHP